MSNSDHSDHKKRVHHIKPPEVLNETHLNRRWPYDTISVQI